MLQISADTRPSNLTGLDSASISTSLKGIQHSALTTHIPFHFCSVLVAVLELCGYTIRYSYLVNPVAIIFAARIYAYRFVFVCIPMSFKGRNYAQM